MKKEGVNNIKLGLYLRAPFEIKVDAPKITPCLKSPLGKN